MKKPVIVLLFLLFSPYLAMGEIGTAVDPSRNIYSGRTVGMGGAHVGIADDGEGIFSNPAALTRLEFPQLVGMTKKIMLEEAAYTIWGWAVPTSWGTFGLGYTGSLISESPPTMRDPGTNRIMLDPAQEATSYENSVSIISYAKKLREDFSLGANLKYFNQVMKTSVPLDRGTGTGLDISLYYQPRKYLSLGLNLQNIVGTGIGWVNSTEKIGGYYKFGLGLKLSGKEALYDYPQEVVAGIDLDIPHDALSSLALLHLGLEWEAVKNFYLRGGINQKVAGTGFSLGIGLVNSAFRFDYAFFPEPGINTENPHYFSIAYVGDRVFTVKDTFRRNTPDIRFLSPRDRSITADELVKLKAEARGSKFFERMSTWSVPLVEATYEVVDTSRSFELNNVRENGYPLDQSGTIEALALLSLGRNVITLSGNITRESVPVSTEVRVLRIIPFSDVPLDHWAIEPVTLLSTLGLMAGYPDKSFKPDYGITRAELTALLVKATGIDDGRLAEARDEALFSDTAGKWYQPYINVGVEIGLVTGYPDHTFNPDKVLSRAEGIALLSRFARLSGKEGISFPDLKPGFWANKSIQAAKEAGFLQYLAGRSFEPEKYFSRAEAAEVIYRSQAIQRKVDDFWDYGVTL